jgi:hypothetical protein
MALWLAERRQCVHVLHSFWLSALTGFIAAPSAESDNAWR